MEQRERNWSRTFRLVCWTSCSVGQETTVYKWPSEGVLWQGRKLCMSRVSWEAFYHGHPKIKMAIQIFSYTQTWCVPRLWSSRPPAATRETREQPTLHLHWAAASGYHQPGKKKSHSSYWSTCPHGHNFFSSSFSLPVTFSLISCSIFSNSLSLPGEPHLYMSRNCLEENESWHLEKRPSAHGNKGHQAEGECWVNVSRVLPLSEPHHQCTDDHHHRACTGDTHTIRMDEASQCRSTSPI